MEKYSGKLDIVAGREEAGAMEEEAQEEDMSNGSIFSELKHHCIQLVGLYQNPQKNPYAVTQLLHLLQRLPSPSIHPFFDYILFPLLLLFDAAVNCRSSINFESKDKSLAFNALETPHQVSDSVAEEVVFCLEEILKKCRLGSVDQMVVILKKLSHGASLSPLEGSEEFREGVIRCFRALMLNLCPCSDDDCPCKQIGDWPIFPAEKELPFFPASRLSIYDSVPKECLLTFLQSEPASAAVGHWLSLLLKAADVEATRGHRGSSRLRVEALMTLRVLVAKVGTADALAFYLPGVVSQIGKVLHVSRTMISGAAGSTEALSQAVRGLTEYLGIVLEDDSLGVRMNDSSGPCLSKDKPLASFLEELRNLPAKNQERDEKVADSFVSPQASTTLSGQETHLKSSIKNASLRVKRTTDWLKNTTLHVNKLLSATFPHLCLHPTTKVRLGLLAAVKVLLCKCSYTLKESRQMLLECLFVLICDDSEEVSSDAKAFFGLVLSSRENDQLEHDTTEIFSRLVEKLPQVMLSNEESLSLLHARKLLAVTCFCGPRLISDYLLLSPVNTARFLDVFALCMSQKSVFSGSLNKLASTKPSSHGFIHSIAEIKATNNVNHGNSEYLGFQNRKLLPPLENLQKEYELPKMPPWFSRVGSQKLYETLGGILRLVSLYMFADSRIEGSFSMLIDILLGHLRNLIAKLRTKEYCKESWQSWYKRTGSGDLVRQASTATCILNEIVFGLSDQAITSFSRMFESNRQQDNKEFIQNSIRSCEYKYVVPEHYVQKISKNCDARSHLIDIIGVILHEYLSTEVWDLPLEYSASLQQSGEDGEISLHFFHDNAMLHQVIIEGIGIFSICLSKEFSTSGFLQSSLYRLLENVICSNFHVRRASDAVLLAISAAHGCPTVGHLVLANSDYVIDSICQQLRHLDLNPHASNVLASMLSYIGVADKILPLLDEPMRTVSMELEILGRHQHPNLTISFLKVVAEIAKASKREASTLPNQVESYRKVVDSIVLNEEQKTDSQIWSSEADKQVHECESILFKLNDSRRYRQIVGSIAGSCLVAVTPLISSSDPAACFIALDVVEDGIKALTKMEEAYKHEKEIKEVIEQFIQSHSFHGLQDNLDAAKDETGENRLLPAMNKIWPFFVSCFQNKNLLAIRRCCQAISTTVQICGGDFFSRRFHSDGAYFWKLLNTSPLQKKPISKNERKPMQLPYRSGAMSSEDPMSELSNLKAQISILDMISDLASDKKSASALASHAVLKKISGVVVGIACSGVKGLQDASVKALAGLACIDPDLIWLLLADVYYSTKKDLPSPPSEFPEITELLPPPLGKEYLYVLYGGQSYGFDIDFTSVECVFKKLCALVFAEQMYS
ncbi:uncharacterized protein [Primulina huaijiensis]|uniref:uncharacterized protein isoform X2 n=1 Tax=Primulina huaijiensis TaxID=1492673 RepID=UPI003CC75ED6